MPIQNQKMLVQEFDAHVLIQEISQEQIRIDCLDIGLRFLKPSQNLHCNMRVLFFFS